MKREIYRSRSVNSSTNLPQKDYHTAMKTQHKLMYGLSLSPIRAHFQKMPMNLPTLRVSSCFAPWQTTILRDTAVLPVLIPIEYRREHLVDVGGRADQEKDDEEERLEVEEGGLG